MTTTVSMFLSICIAYFCYRNRSKSSFNSSNQCTEFDILFGFNYSISILFYEPRRKTMQICKPFLKWLILLTMSFFVFVQRDIDSWKIQYLFLVDTFQLKILKLKKVSTICIFKQFLWINI